MSTMLQRNLLSHPVYSQIWLNCRMWMIATLATFQNWQRTILDVSKQESTSKSNRRLLPTEGMYALLHSGLNYCSIWHHGCFDSQIWMSWIAKFGLKISMVWSPFWLHKFFDINKKQTTIQVTYLNNLIGHRFVLCT
jgi:hypothetical protein